MSVIIKDLNGLTQLDPPCKLTLNHQFTDLGLAKLVRAASPSTLNLKFSDLNLDEFNVGYVPFVK